MASVLDQIKKSLENRDGKWTEKKGVWSFSTTIAERKAFLSKKKLTYSLKVRVDDGTKVVKFSEMLIEAGFVHRQQLEQGLNLQRKLVNAALIAAISFISALGVAPVHAYEPESESGSARLTVSARVTARASLKVLAQASQLSVTKEDIQRGYIDVPAASRIEISSNSPGGCLLAFENTGLPLKEVHVIGLGQNVQISSGNGWIPRPDKGRLPTQEELSYRFVLSDNTQPGTYAWPLAMSVMAR